MARFRHHSVHRKRQKGCSGVYLLLLLLLLVATVWIFTFDLANSSLFDWMRTAGYQVPENRTKLYMQEDIHFASNMSDEILWISYPLDAERKDDWLATYHKPLTEVNEDSVQLFYSEQLGKPFSFSISNAETPVWNEFVKQAADWTSTCDSLFIILGRTDTDRKWLYTANFCLSEQPKTIAYLLNQNPSDKPLFEYAITVDSLEILTKIDFFGDLLGGADEARLESRIQRLSWPYELAYFNKRIEENKLLE